ncbi:peptide/nickel transport system permease protein [Rhizobium sp. 57MFTsu3.2]|nr:peptide/nickel transport system permease protein [Rhizobium sp. 57MFTsu3.2]
MPAILVPARFDERPLSMLTFVIKRIAMSIPVLIGITALLFIMLNVIPGDPIALLMKEHASADVINRVRAQMHLDDPLITRYFRFLFAALQGDLGVSIKLNRDVTTLILNAFPSTLILTICAALVSWVIGIPVGVLSAVRRDSLLDHLFMGFSLLGVSMPIFWSALLMQYVFALKLKWLPVSGFYGYQYVIMPAIVLGWSSAGVIARLTRSSLLEVMRHDYIRTARAKGLRELMVIRRHALKNALIPVVTIMAIQVAGLLSGAVITEAIFGIPGVGRISVSAIQARDMPLLQGSVLFATVLVIFGNLVADILYSVLDPRIRSEMKGGSK